jgi:hypothetical protein
MNNYDQGELSMTRYGEYCEFLRHHVKTTDKDSKSAMVSLDAITAFERIMDAKNSSSPDLRKVVLAATSKYRGPLNIGLDLLSKLTNEFPSIVSVFRELSESRSAYERWVSMVAAKDYQLPGKLAFDLVQKGLNDKSARVRTYAYEAVLTNYFVELAPKLAERATLEKNTNARLSLDWVIEHMEHN